MKTKSWRHLLIFIAALVGASCARTHEPTPGPEEDDLQRLVRLSKADERSQRLPAVERLGKLASTDEELCEEIWAGARVNTLGMKFVEIEPGTFTMGPDVHRWPASTAVAHPVQITEPYFIAVTEVTNAQFKRLFPEYEADSRWSPDPDSPAVNVLWDDANRFCELLSEREAVRYRLPTEAEWEYACRAGTTTLFCFGEDPTRLAQFGWHNYANGRASRVAMLLPNNWSIYDMHGNAVEWVSDWYSLSYYSECAASGLVQDPQGPPNGRTHTLRGGGWPARNRWACSSTSRCPLPILDRVPFSKEVGFRHVVGFRVIREKTE
ncbi:MAG: formylglycine-generating enzyme family protein [Planctomycetota bacterium]|jgi:formylglycine-generating enzyme required for sulfatase activity